MGVKNYYTFVAKNLVDRYYNDETGDMPYGNYSEIKKRVIKFANTPFPDGLKNMPSKPILYRLLNVSSKADINTKNLGKSYVGNKDMYDDPDFLESFLYRYGEEQKKWFIIKIETALNNIDIEHSMSIVAEYPDEIEFTLIDDRNLKILDIEEYKRNW